MRRKRPTIDSASFGSITIGGKKYGHDIILRLDGAIEKRKKKLSKRIYGTSHTISLDEATDLYENGAELLIVGTGMFDSVRLSDEAEAFFGQHNCQLTLARTSRAVKIWNNAQGKVIGLFHVTC